MWGDALKRISRDLNPQSATSREPFSSEFWSRVFLPITYVLSLLTLRSLTLTMPVISKAMPYCPQAYEGRSIVVRNVNCRIYCDSEFPCTLSLSGTLQLSSFRVALLTQLSNTPSTWQTSNRFQITVGDERLSKRHPISG